MALALFLALLTIPPQGDRTPQLAPLDTGTTFGTARIEAGANCLCSATIDFSAALRPGVLRAERVMVSAEMILDVCCNFPGVGGAISPLDFGDNFRLVIAAGAQAACSETRQCSA